MIESQKGRLFKCLFPHQMIESDYILITRFSRIMSSCVGQREAFSRIIKERINRLYLLYLPLLVYQLSEAELSN